MSMRVACGFFVSLLLAIATSIAPAGAQQETRRIVTSDGSDYFGFDLRTEQGVTLDECKAVCLGDPSCRAFTYNTKAKWCFLKSDYSVKNPFPGAVAGKVVDDSDAPDIGAPPPLTFLPDYLEPEARQYRLDTVGAKHDGPAAGLGWLIAAGENAGSAGDPRAAVLHYAAALAIEPNDGAVWAALARAANAIEPRPNEDLYPFQRAGTAAAINAYHLSRSAEERAEALATLAKALERRNLFRPALDAYDASLALVDAEDVRAAFEELRSTKGFRIVEHTVDADAVSPRICVQFSEPLAKSGTDYASFVTVNDAAPKAVEARENELCAVGLRHGENYSVTLRAGLPAGIGETLAQPVTLDIYVRDRAPAARFTGDNFVLPSAARRSIPVVTVNTSALTLKLFRVGERALPQILSTSEFLSQLDGYGAQRIADELGEPVWEGKLDVASELNKEVVTGFPVDEAIPERKPGVYVLTAAPESGRLETWDAVATQWFVVSDIGLSTYAGEDGLHVFARSLGSAAPLANVELQLLARNNEVLGTATTDASGRAALAPGLTRGTSGMAPAALLAKAGADFVFLDLTRPGFDLSDRGVTGRAAPGAVDVLAWTERGIYRAGETVHVAALARDAKAEAIENLPLTFIFHRPDGVEDRRVVSEGAALGGHALDLDLPQNAMHGTWAVAVHTDPKAEPVATVNFLVEDFVPDRIEFDLTALAEEIVPGVPAEMQVDGRYLYGAPATGLAIEGEINLTATHEWEAFPGYLFGLADEETEASRIPLQNLPALDESGKAVFDIRLDELPSTTQLINAEVVVRMRESGGRAVERRTDVSIRAQDSIIGIKPQFSDGTVRENSRAEFKVIAADPDGERIDLSGLNWTLVKVIQEYQWYREGSSWNYEPVEHTEQVADGVIHVEAGREAEISVPVGWGRYRLEVSTADPTGPATSVAFDAGWHVEASSTETPDGLEIALDKQSYAAGEVAKLQVSPRFSGELLVTVGSDRLLAVQTATVPETGAVIDIPVDEDWGAGAYVTATLFRPGEAQESRMPMRAIGLKWLAVDPAERKLEVRLSPPAKIEPRQALDIPIEVTGAGSETAYVMVAAVDVGILNLTAYEAPDPAGWYFGQRQLGLELRDLYGRLIDGSAGAMGRIRTGGDGGSMTAQGSAPTEKLVAFFSGPVRLDADGKAVVSFDIPQFNGTVRVMAVAWTRNGVGNSSADVIVRDPVVVTASMPKFLAPGDQSELRLDIASTDAPAGDYELVLEVDGPVAVSESDARRTLRLETGGRTSLTIPVLAGNLGDAAVSISLTPAAGGQEIAQAMSLPVRPAALPVTTRTVVSLAANGGSLRVDRELLAASLLDGATVSIGVSRASAFDVPSLLMSLDRYPYGCAEQTTSVAMPLLYLSELAVEAGIEDDPAIRERVQDAIHKVLAYQSSSGSFGLWSPGSGDLWLDAYVTDFLTRAREKKYEVPEQGMRSALENLQNALAYEVDVAANGTEIAYALYVLARNRRAAAGDLRYYTDTLLESFATPLARAQLAASLALYGDAPRAQMAFGSAFELARAPDTANNVWRSDYGSLLRDGAAMLALAAETRPLPPAVPEMVQFVSRLTKGRDYTSTQEQAWMLLAARAIREGSSDIALTVNGTQHDGRFSQRLTGEDLLAAPVTIVNRSSEPVEATVTAIAAPIDPPPAGGDGFSIERTYYRLDGTEANVTQAAQNERFLAVLRITEENAWPSRVLVQDLLPAGFEIDNPRIVGSADLSNFEWLGQTEVAHAEFRFDRFVAAFNRNDSSPRDFTVAYMVRAVTPGVYAHPAASVEDMYRPQLSARTASGVMEVTAAR